MNIKQPCIIDVSHWEGRPNWDQVIEGNKAAGNPITGVICKASEHTGYMDDTFAWNWANLKRLGVPRGAYHFYRFEYDAVKQADFFLRVLDQNGGIGEYPPVLDAEWKDYRDPRTRRWVRSPKGTRLTDQFKVWMDIVETATGKIPMFYSSESYINEYMRDWTGKITLPDYNRYPLWLAQYPYKPDDFNSPYRLPKGWTNWALWQYAEAGRLVGYPYDGVDLNMASEFFDGGSGNPVPPDDNPYKLPREVLIKAYPNLRVRNGAGAQFAILDRLATGTICTVVEVSEENGNLWGRIGEGRWIAIQYYGNIYAEWK